MKIKLSILIIISSLLCQAQLQESDLFLEWNGKNWINTSKNGYVVTNIIEQNLYGNNVVINGKKTYSYNSSKQVTEIITERWSASDDLVPETREIYTYYPDSKIIEENWHYWSKTVWGNPLIKKFSYKYNAQNKCTERTELKKGSDNKWTKERGNIYKYNAKGQLIKDSFNIVNSYTTLIEFKYDAFGNCIEELQDGHHRTTKSYDLNKNMIEEKTQFWENEQWTDSWIWNNSYDEKNNLIESKETRWKGSQWKNNIKYVFKYDDLGNQVEKVNWHFDDGQWIAKHKTIYHYEQLDLAQEQTYKQIKTTNTVEQIDIAKGQKKQIEFYGYSLMEYQRAVPVSSNKYEPYFKNMGESMERGRIVIDETAKTFTIKWDNGDDWECKFSKKEKKNEHDDLLGDVERTTYTGKWTNDNSDCLLVASRVTSSKCYVMLKSRKVVDIDKGINTWKKGFTLATDGKCLD